jgi:hypothetical protein
MSNLPDDVSLAALDRHLEGPAWPRYEDDARYAQWLADAVSLYGDAAGKSTSIEALHALGAEDWYADQDTPEAFVEHVVRSEYADVREATLA